MRPGEAFSRDRKISATRSVVFAGGENHERGEQQRTARKAVAPLAVKSAARFREAEISKRTLRTTVPERYRRAKRVPALGGKHETPRRRTCVSNLQEALSTSLLAQNRRETPHRKRRHLNTAEGGRTENAGTWAFSCGFLRSKKCKRHEVPVSQSETAE